MRLCQQQSSQVVLLSRSDVELLSADVGSFHAGDCYQRTVVRILLPVCDISGSFLLDQSCLGCRVAFLRTRNCSIAGSSSSGE